jgi:hypothetical protein
MISEPKPSSLCPCGSNCVAACCCLQKDGLWYKKPSITSPALPKTNKSVNKCYARALNDCDGPISGEHYISYSVLKQLGSNVALGGVPWSEQPISIPTKQVTGKILCKRHNESLSSLDATAGKLFEAIQNTHKGIKAGWVLLNGEDIERWMMKLLFGIIASGNIRPRDGHTAEKTCPPMPYLNILFGHKPMPPGCGLRFLELAETAPRQENQIEITINTGMVNPGPHHSIIYGIRIGLMGLNLHTCLKQLPNSENLQEKTYYRPKRLYLGEFAVIDITWPDPKFDQAIILDGFGSN